MPILHIPVAILVQFSKCGHSIHQQMAPKGAKQKVKTPPKAKTSPPTVKTPPGPLPVLQSWQDGINKEYLEHVRTDLTVITARFPTITTLDALPQSGTQGFQGLVGFGVPFNAELYSERFATRTNYQTHFNFFHMDMFRCFLSFVPLYRERVVELADTTLTAPHKVSTITLLANFADGTQLPKGELLRVSPCEPCHAILHKFASLIRDETTPTSVLNEWLCVLLSYPCIFTQLTNDDDKFAEANSLRQDAASIARAVNFTARQMVYCIAGFKKTEEA